MCLNIYIGSKKILPAIKVDESNSGFYLKEVINTEQDYPFIKDLLSADFLYSASSYLGCACGLASGKEYIDDDHDLRVRDLNAMFNYLNLNLPNNQIKIFCTWWEIFKDNHEMEDFSLQLVNSEAFEFKEDIILNVKF